MEIDEAMVRIATYENGAKKKLEQARAEARKIAGDAEAAGRTLYEQRERDAEREAKRLLEEAEAKAQSQAEEIANAATERVQLLRSAFGKMQGRVLEQALRTLFGKL